MSDLILSHRIKQLSYLVKNVGKLPVCVNKETDSSG